MEICACFLKIILKGVIWTKQDKLDSNTGYLFLKTTYYILNKEIAVLSFKEF